MSKSWTKKLPRHLSLGFLIVVCWAALLWFLSTELFATLVSNLSKENLAVSALLGDSFGTFSSLMAAFAALGAILALTEQRAAVRRQMFLGTLTVLLTRFQQTIDGTEYIVVGSEPSGQGLIQEKIEATQRGQGAFFEISQELRLYIEENILEGMGFEEVSGLIALLYPDFYRSYKDELGHFFRQFYHIIKYIDEEGGEECDRFMKIVRASLTNAQLLLLAYNCISGEGRIKFAKYIREYSLLHNLSFEDDFLGRIERSLITSRIGEAALVSKSQRQDRFDQEFLERQMKNTVSKNALRRFLDERGFSSNYGVSWQDEI